MTWKADPTTKDCCREYIYIPRERYCKSCKGCSKVAQMEHRCSSTWWWWLSMLLSKQNPHQKRKKKWKWSSSLFSSSSEKIVNNSPFIILQFLLWNYSGKKEEKKRQTGIVYIIIPLSLSLSLSTLSLSYFQDGLCYDVSQQWEKQLSFSLTPSPSIYYTFSEEREREIGKRKRGRPAGLIGSEVAGNRGEKKKRGFGLRWWWWWIEQFKK